MSEAMFSPFEDEQRMAERVSALVLQLAEVEALLAQETDNGLDAIIDPRTQMPILLRRAQTALRLSEERYRQIIETTTEGIWLCDQDVRTSYVNGHMAEMLGRSVEEFLGRSPLDFVHGESAELMRVKLASLRAGAKIRFDACLHHGDGSRVWVLVSATPLYEEGGKFSGALGLLADISARKHAEDELRDSEERMRGLLSSLQDVVWSAKPGKGELHYASPATKAVYQCEVEEFIKNPDYWFEVIHPDDKDRVTAAGAVLLREGKFEHEYRIVWPDGTIRWLLDRSWAVKNEAGEVVRFDGISRDITAHRAAEEVAAQLRARFAQTFEVLPESFCLFDHDLKFTYANPATEGMSGRTPEELIGKSVLELYPPDEGFDYTLYMREAMSRGETVRFENYYKPLHCCFDIQAIPVPDGLAVYTRDITASREATRQKDAILEGVGANIALLDSRGTIVQVNHAWRAFGEANGLCDSQGGPGSNYLDVVGRAGSESEEVLREMERVIVGESVRFEHEYTCGAVGGPESWWHMVATSVPLGGAVIVHVNITETKVAQFALAESQQHYALAAEGANDGLFDWNVKTGMIFLSPRWKDIIGYGTEELSNAQEEWLSRVHPEDAERVRHEVGRIRPPGGEKLECEFRLQHRDGTYRWVLCRAIAVCDEEFRPLRLVGSISDATDRKVYQERLAHDAMHDALTDLPNRTLLTDRLDRAMKRALRGDGYRYAVLFLDLDHFKHVNDGLGHQVGDLLLIEVARRLSSCVKAQDTVARLGGDEFSVLLDEIGGDSAALLVVKRIHEELARPFMITGREIKTGASIGVLIGTNRYTSVMEVLRDADTAMYRAKGSGRNGYAIFDGAMHAAAFERMEMENELYRALERDELEVHYQPIINLASGRLDGMEALVRWRHPSRGLVSPAEFIPLAEETGQIVALGEWVALEACRSLRRWKEQKLVPEDHLFRISINVSARQFSFNGSAERILAVVGKAGVAPSQVCLEMTETALLKHPALAHEILDKLHAFGFQLHLDDFGTGFSSLSHLREFPIHAVKIDRSFVQGICSSSRNRELVRGIVNLTAGLGLEVVAEGVETLEQAGALKELNCHYAQGFFYSKPIPGDKVEGYLASLYSCS